MNEASTILSLCDYTGNMVEPYRRAGYRIVQVDKALNGQDVRLLKHMPDVKVNGVICQPPCTHLAGSGARWWEAKGETALLEALSIADACLRAVAIYSPRWWVLENPVGRLPDYYGPYSFAFDPCDYGDPYIKRTCLWGKFTPPMPLFVGENMAVEPILGSMMHKLPPSPERAALRSVTPKGFANAFFRANP